MNSIHKQLANVRPVTDRPGSGQLRAGIALMRVGIHTDHYLGCVGGVHWYRVRGTHQQVGVDLVTGRGHLRVGLPL